MKLRSIIKNKRGNVEDSVFIIVMLFAWAIALLVVYYSWGRMKPEFVSAISSAIPAGETSINITETADITTDAVGTYNNLFPLLLIGLFAFVIISAFMINSHPVFFFISLIILLVTITVGVVFSNVYGKIIETDELASTGSTFDVTSLFMKNLPIIAVVAFVIIVIILFSKSGGYQKGL